MVSSFKLILGSHHNLFLFLIQASKNLKIIQQMSHQHNLIHFHAVKVLILETSIGLRVQINWLQIILPEQSQPSTPLLAIILLKLRDAIQQLAQVALTPGAMEGSSRAASRSSTTSRQSSEIIMALSIRLRLISRQRILMPELGRPQHTALKQIISSQLRQRMFQE